MKNNLPTARKFLKFLKYAVPLSFALTLYSCKQMKVLPPLSEISPQIYTSPDQRPIDAEEFVFDYRGESYQVKPLRYYELHGLVVTHNDIESIADAYHTSDSVDIKDLCVVWGDNVRSDVYRKGMYWSEPWTCWHKFNDRATYERFRGDQLSNTHLLSQKDSVREAIKDMTVGDQIRLRGMLIGYAPANSGLPMRMSSLIRTDTGNGACEVMMVDEAEVIREGNVFWRRTYKATKKITMAGAIVFPFLWLFLIFHQQSLVNRELAAAKKRMAARSRRSKRK